MHCTCNQKEIQLLGSLSLKKGWRGHLIVWGDEKSVSRSPLAMALNENNLIPLWTPVHLGPNNLFRSKMKFIDQDISPMASDFSSSPKEHFALMSVKVPSLHPLHHCRKSSISYHFSAVSWKHSHRITSESHYECKAPVLLAEWNHTCFLLWGPKSPSCPHQKLTE